MKTIRPRHSVWWALLTCAPAGTVTGMSLPAQASSCVFSSTPMTYTGSIVTCTVQPTATYLIVAVGGSGGNATGSSGKAQGGAGTLLQGIFDPTAGTTLQFLVGGAGQNGTLTNTDAGGGGGGASYVVEMGSDGPIPLLVAGGGGGAGSNNASPGIGSDALGIEDGTTIAAAGPGNDPGGGNGGSKGSGGDGGVNLGDEGPFGYGGGGGGGFSASTSGNGGNNQISGHGALEV